MSASEEASQAQEEQVAQEQAVEAEVDAEVEADAETEETTEAGAEAEQTAEDAIAQAQAQAKEWQDKYLRLHAEWDTYRRRMNEQRAEEKLRATEKLVEGLIPVVDDFERSIDYAEKNGEEGLLGGVKAVSNKLAEVLAKEGVEVINPKGEAFNALEAQAVGTVPDESQPDETVAEVYQKGYRMGTKVLRAAMVTVTVGGPKRSAEEAEAEAEEE